MDEIESSFGPIRKYHGDIRKISFLDTCQETNRLLILVLGMQHSFWAYFLSFVFHSYFSLIIRKAFTVK